MKLEQIYTGCIAQAAYYLESNGEVAIFDPLREVSPYIERAQKDNATIKYIFETHFHADFVSGHLDLKEKTGAEIIYGPTAQPKFDATIATDNQVFELGAYKIKVIHTPGHTMESTTYLLIDENDQEHGILTGDTLFIGDVGRPDLAQAVVPGLTQEVLAGHLFDSLRHKIMPLSDDLIVYPSHGAGSACGKNMSKETTDTLGNQKKTNYALRADMTKEEFTKELLDGLAQPPQYFPENVLLNINGYESLDNIMARGKTALSPNEFEELANQTEALVLDTRNPEVFAKGFIPNSINIGIDGGFAPWVGAMVPGVTQPILLITEEGREEEVITRLSRVGYDNTLGYLKGGFEAWKVEGREIDTIKRIDASVLAQQYQNNEQPIIIDVRKPGEFQSAHIIGAKHTPLNEINSHLNDIPKEQPFIVHCAGGYRSMIAASILKQRGWDNFTEVRGGFNAIKQQEGISLKETACAATAAATSCSNTNTVNNKNNNDMKDIIKEAFLVDVRTPEEFEEGHVEGSLNIPLHEVPARIEEFKGKGNIIVFCRSGNRSGQAQQFLTQNGIENVFNGGTWQDVRDAKNS